MKSIKRQLLESFTVAANAELAFARSELEDAAKSGSHSGFRRAEHAIERAHVEAFMARDLSAMGSGALPRWARLEAERRGITR